MQIKEAKGRPGYIQIVRSSYDPEKKRSGKQVAVGSMSILKPVPPDLWAKLDGAERAKLMAYIGRRLAELNLAGVLQFAEGLPGKLAELANAWPTLVADLGEERAEELSASILKAWKGAQKALKAPVARQEEEVEGS